MKRILELDGIRGIAVSGVMLTHLFAFTPASMEWGGVGWLVARLTKPGWLGVDLFFVLSGYLITGILLDSKRDPKYFRSFYIKRAFRILPLYLITLIVLLLAYPGSGRFVAFSLVYMSNIAPLFGVPMTLPVLWSLSVEEHFYIFWPVLVRYLSMSHVALLAGLVCIAEPIARALAAPAEIFGFTWYRCDGLAFGALIACFVRVPRFPKRAVLLAALGVAAGLALVVIGIPRGILTKTSVWGAGLQLTAAYLVFSGIIIFAIACSGRILTAPFRIPALMLLGELSYCLYLCHTIVEYGYDAIIRTPPENFGLMTARAMAVVAGSIGVALLSRKYVERPAFRVRDRLLKERSRTSVAVGVRT